MVIKIKYWYKEDEASISKWNCCFVFLNEYLVTRERSHTMERLTTEDQADNSGGQGGNLAVSEGNVDNNRTSEESEAGASFTDTGNILNEEVLVYTGLSIGNPQGAVFQSHKARREK